MKRGIAFFRIEEAQKEAELMMQKMQAEQQQQ
jgi:hypothetical protein